MFLRELAQHAALVSFNVHPKQVLVLLMVKIPEMRYPKAAALVKSRIEFYDSDT